jgi:hypothetical protein
MDIYEGLNAYKTYVAVRNHFKQDSYDFFKYRGKTNVGVDSFLKRNDKYFFAKLQRKLSEHELVYFFVANFIVDDSSWSGSLVTENSMTVYNQWKNTIESLTYIFKQDCLLLKEAVDNNGKSFDNLFDCQGSHPPLLKMFLGKHIRLETMVIIDRVLRYRKRWSKDLDDDIVWSNACRLIDKYSSFVKVDDDKYKAILKTTFI